MQSVNCGTEPRGQFLLHWEPRRWAAQGRGCRCHWGWATLKGPVCKTSKGAWYMGKHAFQGGFLKNWQWKMAAQSSKSKSTKLFKHIAAVWMVPVVTFLTASVHQAQAGALSHMLLIVSTEQCAYMLGGAEAVALQGGPACSPPWLRGCHKHIWLAGSSKWGNGNLWPRRHPSAAGRETPAALHEWKWCWKKTDGWELMSLASCRWEAPVSATFLSHHPDLLLT